MSASYKRTKGKADHSQGGYTAQFLYNGEGATIIASTVKPGGKGPAHHIHEHADQLYYVTRGEMTMQIGSEVHKVGPDTLVYLPSGTPHHNWNETDEEEFHFEMLSPSPLITQAVATMTDSTDAPGGHFIRTLEEVGLTEALPGFSTARLLQREDGSEHMALYIGKVDPGGAGPGTHIHQFDQFYYVLEGELTVEVADTQFVAKPDELVILHAGVPHRQWNAGDVPERHITLLVPEPREGEEWDVGVDFAPNGVVIG